MWIPDYRNVHGVKDLNHWKTKTSRVVKANEDTFEKELENSVHKRKSEEKKGVEKETQKNRLRVQENLLASSGLLITP